MTIVQLTILQGMVGKPPITISQFLIARWHGCSIDLNNGKPCDRQEQDSYHAATDRRLERSVGHIRGFLSLR